ncbi:MAG TPA: lipopolysaccharide assembly protein LapB, partial [Gammaproteobacteria bacterium]|nr:lipopolysaccharide assembly protein LapB [Gammaproteobacteria bacterium]
NIEKSQGKYKQALKAYKQVQYQDPDFVCEVIIPIQQCYEKLNAKEDMLRYLDQVIKSCPHISVVLATAAQYKRFRGDREAAVFLAEHMREKPSIRGIRHLVDYHLVQAKEEVRDDLLILRCMMDKLLENKPTYRCNHCGFSTKTLHWQCPSCRQWSSIKPIHRIDGE